MDITRFFCRSSHLNGWTKLVSSALAGMIVFAVCAFTAPLAFALQLTLQWEQPAGAEAKGYKIHYGHEFGNYTTTIDVGKTTTYTVSKLEDGQDYHFSVSAFNDEEESVFSEEVQYFPVYDNRPPAVDDLSIEVDEGTPASGNLMGRDRDGNSLRYAIVQPPSKGTLRLEDSTFGAFTYIPNPDARGLDSFVYKANDGLDDSNVGLVALNIAYRGLLLNPDPWSAQAGVRTQSIEGSSSQDDQTVVAINAGGPEYVDGNGVVYQSDTYFSGGATNYTWENIDCTTDDLLYGTERYGDFSYNVPLSPGDYILTLKFAEIHWISPGKRVFEVWVEGEQQVSHLDIGQSAGPLRPVDIHLPVRLLDDSLDISFRSIVDQSKLSAIQVRRSSQQVVYAINAGGQRYTTPSGVTYEADSLCTAGSTSVQSRTVEGTLDQVLYQSERYGDFSYDLDVANGEYLVTLSFAETYWNEDGQRIFDVLIEGEEVLSNLDLYATAGKDAAFDFTHTAVVIDGRLNISFQSKSDSATVCGVLVQALN